ncbi:MAG TPA: thiamine phosphate synthase [Phycisphaerae bacterium]|nr:thiamine phosphate synthase [Phycisphaerae bacterium]HNU44913.1 thiamine phosphate synthase [Phycisphaerae bacterium]
MGSTWADNTAARILDANLNRAREALRVMEEYARFALDDPTLTAALKKLRHTLVQDMATALGNRLVPARDIVHDVGRDVTTPTEYVRADAPAIVRAAAARLSEALRVLEEYAKLLDPPLAARIEQARYEAYELERRLVLHIHAWDSFGHVRLYVLLTESLCRGDWCATAEAALRGGADCLQLREKHLPDRELLDRARRLARLCHNHGALLIVNDRPDIAAATGADGVHLGQDDLPVAAARRVLPTGAVVGLSTHTPDQLTDALVQAPDYVAVGPMFPTATKPQDLIAGPELLRTARARTSLPVVAIGGITADNAETVLAVRRCCLAVCAGIVAQQDVEAATRRLRTLLDRCEPPSPENRAGDPQSRPA